MSEEEWDKVCVLSNMHRYLPWRSCHANRHHPPVLVRQRQGPACAASCCEADVRCKSRWRADDNYGLDSGMFGILLLLHSNLRSDFPRESVRVALRCRTR